MARKHCQYCKRPPEYKRTLTHDGRLFRYWEYCALHTTRMMADCDYAIKVDVAQSYVISEEEPVTVSRVVENG